jgi:hypothetical protein
MPSKSRHRRNKILLVSIGIPLVLIVAGVILLGRRPGQGHPNPAGENPYQQLLRKLTLLEADLNRGMSAPQMQDAAAAIETEIRLHPLPPDDALQFSGELIVRYLRELAAVENARALKAGAGKTNSTLSETNTSNTVEKREKYPVWLRDRIKVLKEGLQSRNAIGNTNQPPMSGN